MVGVVVAAVEWWRMEVGGGGVADVPVNSRLRKDIVAIVRLWHRQRCAGGWLWERQRLQCSWNGCVLTE